MSTNPLYGIPSTRTSRPSPDVVRWRLDRLTDAGFDGPLAAGLADEADIDLHALLNLVDRGCHHTWPRGSWEAAQPTPKSAPMDEVEPVAIVNRSRWWRRSDTPGRRLGGSAA